MPGQEMAQILENVPFVLQEVDIVMFCPADSEARIRMWDEDASLGHDDLVNELSGV
jgi:hypothetical protein